ncbi:MAG: hypothetical protein M4579_003631 [Chaenotheca gracillima]|nr:MAG: hypothetical protein M4579_003631 [Chaenotheca gracillima]
MLEQRRSSSPYVETRQAPIGQGSGSTTRSPAKPYLDPTSSAFTTSRGLDDLPKPFPVTSNIPNVPGNGFQRYSVDSNNQRSSQAFATQGAPDTQGRNGFSTAGTGFTNNHYRTDNYQTQPEGLGAAFLEGNPFGNTTGQPSTFSQSRPGHSAHSSSFSSQPNARRFELPGRETSHAEMLAGLDRINLGDAGAPQAYGQMSTTLGMTGPPGQYSSQPSFEYGYQPAITAGNPPWNYDDQFTNAGNFSSEGFPDGQYMDQFTGQRAQRSTERGPMSPAGSDRRQSYHQSPFYSTGGTPPHRSDQSRGATGAANARPRPTPNGHSTLLEQKLRGVQKEQQGYVASSRNPMIPHDQFPVAPMGNNYDYLQGGAMGFGAVAPYSSVPGLPPGTIVPRGPAKDQELAHSMRSPLLEEYRASSKTSRKWELRDIYNHLCEFSGDQHGSRFIQLRLETANSDEKDQVFREIKPNCLQLMTDVFGNYVIQKFFEHGTQQQKTGLADQMKGHILHLSLQMYGCRALEHILVDQQASLIKELDVHILKCVKDQNGNHVIQKAIERVPREHISFIIDAFAGQVHTLATHPYGCRVIQRMLEHCDVVSKASILQELHSCSSTLIQDQYGNYVTQHIIELGEDEDRNKVIALVMSQLLHLSKHKFASNVVEKSIEFGKDYQRREIMNTLTALEADGSSPLQILMKDQYGNYVIQKLLGQMKGADYDKLVEQIRPQLAALKKCPQAKQINAIEKLIPATPQSSSFQASTPPPGASAAPTPPLLTMDAQSPQSSSLPSENNSTCDGPVETGDQLPKEPEETEQRVTIAAPT